MLIHASAIKGYAIAASDGEIGTVSDLLFDDVSWRVRWLVVETGTWLAGRKVLLPASTLGHADAIRREFRPQDPAGEADQAASQGQPQRRHRAAGFSASGEQHLRPLWLVPLLGLRALHGQLWLRQCHGLALLRTQLATDRG